MHIFEHLKLSRTKFRSRWSYTYPLTDCTTTETFSRGIQTLDAKSVSDNHVDVKSEAGQEALRSAAANGHADVVELLDE